MDEITKAEVIRLLNDATYGAGNGDQTYPMRMALLEQSHGNGEIQTMHYIQLVDAVNTQNKTGSYEGCIIWRNAEANPLQDANEEENNS